MGLNLSAYDQMMKGAVLHFWEARQLASKKQAGLGKSDQGNRSGVTAGKNLDQFCDMTRQIIIDNGIPEQFIFTTGRANLTIPGYFRPTKNWDLLVVREGQLLAAIEFKSQVGSFGNNFNNRVEEALGNATDILTAYREGMFGQHRKPFLGFFFVLEDCEEALRTVSVSSKHFDCFPEFNETGYAQRYALLCEKLVRENLYDAAGLVLTPASAVDDGYFREMNSMSSPRSFVQALAGSMLGFGF